MTDLIGTKKLGRCGLSLTKIGFGGGPVGWLNGELKDLVATAAIEAAWDAGIRYFDTAPYYGYGNGEQRLGNALRGKPRTDFIVSSKVGRLINRCNNGTTNAESFVYDYSRDGTLRSIEASITRLGLDRIDIVLIHDIDRWTHGAQQPKQFAAALDGAYHVLTDLRAQGIITAIGLGVNEWQVCHEFAKRVPIDCCLLAGRLTLLEIEATETFVPFCETEGIGLIIGGPFNSGILATGTVAEAQYDYAPAPARIMARVRRLEEICERYGLRLSAAALAYPLQFSPVSSVIPGLANATEVCALRENFGSSFPSEFWAEITAEQMKEC